MGYGPWGLKESDRTEHAHTHELQIQCAGGGLVTQSCPAFCNPTDCSPPGSVPVVLQATTLEWVATSFSNKISV